MEPVAQETDRNRLALDRTVLANERTYQAWLRTGLAALASGLGVARFLKDMLPLWMLLVVTSALILFSIVAFLLASWRYTHIHVRIQHLDIDAIPTWLVKMLSLLLIGCSILALFGLMLMALF